MSDWKQFYESQMKLRKGYEEVVPSLRFERKSVWASDLGSQLFCENSLELDYVLGELETEEMRMGREAHKEFSESFPRAELKGVLKSMFSDRLSLTMELTLIAWHQGEEVFMLGRPDGMFFVRGIPLLVLELKFNKYTRPFPSYHAQARFYCSMLKQLGFNTSKLYYAIGMGPKDYSGPIISKKIANRLGEIIATQTPPDHTAIEGVHFYFTPFDYSSYQDQFHKLISYWKKERKASPQTNPNKCKGCKRRSNCGRSLV